MKIWVQEGISIREGRHVVMRDWLWKMQDCIQAGVIIARRRESSVALHAMTIIYNILIVVFVFDVLSCLCFRV